MQIFMRRMLSLLLVFVSTMALAQSSYYSSIDGVDGGETLKTALYNLLKEHTRIDYGSGAAATWGAFYTTDVVLGTTNQVADMYSNEVRYFGTKGTAVDGMNIEHSVAKSWWGGDKNDAYCDLHHLNPSDQDANSRKSNYPLAELESVSWNNGVTFVGKATIEGSSVSAYEPCDEYKGDFARTFMYMFTCYQNLTFKYTWMNYESSTYPTLKPWAVELLLKWHKNDPVSAKEVARNNAVYAIQGNRNPYIDYPQLADYVWGDSVDYVFHLSGEVSDGGGTSGDNTKTFIMESFSSSLGVFTSVSTQGDYSWTIKYGSAYVSAYESYVDNAAVCWLVSPSLDFSEESAVNISFDYVTKYNETDKVAEHNQLLVSKDYAGDVSTATWTVVDFSVVENGTDWTFTSTGDVALPAEFMGESNVTIAFKYTSTTTKAGIWEVKNVVVSSATPADNTGGDDDGDNGDSDGDTGSDNDDAGNDGNFTSGSFTLVTDAETLTVGDTIIIAYDNFVMGAQSGNYRERIEGAVISNDVMTSYPEGTQKIVLEEGVADGSFAFNADGLYLSAVSSSSNYLHSLSSLDAASSWVITVSDDGAAVIVSQGAYTKNTIQYNTSAPRFSCYSGSQQSVYVYAKSNTGTTSVNNVIIAESASVDVYNLFGVCIRTKVERASALNGLPKGFYIVDGKKMYNK